MYQADAAPAGGYSAEMFRRFNVAFFRWFRSGITVAIATSLITAALFAAFERESALTQWTQLLIYPGAAALIVGLTKSFLDVRREELASENRLALQQIESLPGFSAPATDRVLLDSFLCAIPRHELSRNGLLGPMRDRITRIGYVGKSDPRVEAKVADVAESLFTILLSSDVRVIRPYTRFGRETAYFYDRRRLRFLLRLHRSSPPRSLF